MKSETMDVLIEIALGSNLKYEKCKKTGLLRCDRILHSPYSYPFNYGYFPETLAGDGDELDAVVMTRYPLLPNSLITCKIIGALQTEDEKGMDDKIICVPISSVDQEFTNISDLSQLKDSERDMVEYFFKHYKSREYNKFVKILGFVDSKTANDLYKDAIEAYKKKMAEPFKMIYR